jgi:hypothetical protein
MDNATQTKFEAAFGPETIGVEDLAIVWRESGTKYIYENCLCYKRAAKVMIVERAKDLFAGSWTAFNRFPICVEKTGLHHWGNPNACYPQICLPVRWRTNWRYADSLAFDERHGCWLHGRYNEEGELQINVSSENVASIVNRQMERDGAWFMLHYKRAWVPDTRDLRWFAAAFKEARQESYYIRHCKLRDSIWQAFDRQRQKEELEDAEQKRWRERMQRYNERHRKASKT